MWPKYVKRSFVSQSLPPYTVQTYTISVHSLVQSTLSSAWELFACRVIYTYHSVTVTLPNLLVRCSLQLVHKTENSLFLSWPRHHGNREFSVQQLFQWTADDNVHSVPFKVVDKRLPDASLWPPCITTTLLTMRFLLAWLGECLSAMYVMVVTKLLNICFDKQAKLNFVFRKCVSVQVLGHRDTVLVHIRFKITRIAISHVNHFERHSTCTDSNQKGLRNVNFNIKGHVRTSQWLLLFVNPCGIPIKANPGQRPFDQNV